MHFFIEMNIICSKKLDDLLFFLILSCYIPLNRKSRSSWSNSPPNLFCATTKNLVSLFSNCQIPFFVNTSLFSFSTDSNNARRRSVLGRTGHRSAGAKMKEEGRLPLKNTFASSLLFSRFSIQLYSLSLIASP